MKKEVRDIYLNMVFIEYYNLIKEALLHAPSNPFLKWAYWNKELGRYARFRDCHKTFIDYYESDSHENDRTNGDHLVARLRALKLYNEYVTDKIKKLWQEMTP